MEPIRFFVSHTSQYRLLATGIKMALESLHGERTVQVAIHEFMPGATDWRKWIEQSTRAADAFLLLYPHADMDMDWPNYEVARFLGQNDDRENRVFWICNPDVTKLPAVFEPYQAYRATGDDIYRFFKEVFYDGALTNGEPLNEKVGKSLDPICQQAKDFARDVANLFAEASVRQFFYTRRIEIILKYDGKRTFNAQESTVEGKAESMKLIGMNANMAVSWAAVRRTLADRVEWPAELENQISALVQGTLPAYLSPFSQDHKIYIPVISKTEVGQSLLRRVSVIFVEADPQRLRPMFDWRLPDATPEQLVIFAALMRMILRVRYDILEPTYHDLLYSTVTKDDVRAISESVLAAYEDVRQESRKANLRGGDSLYMLFDASLKSQIEAAINEYIVAIKTLAALAVSARTEDEGQRDWGAELLGALGALRENNVHWLDIAAAQFTIFVHAWR